ncbi:MAG: hypothetical protein JWN95_2991 [Frankiales bacterium]|nr:hypothetical protein [Frankiales bacterium]
MRSIRRFLTIITGFAFAAALFAPAAMAQRPADGSLATPAQPNSPTATSGYDSTPLWQFAVVAIAAVILTLLVVAAVNRRSHRADRAPVHASLA